MAKKGATLSQISVDIYPNMEGFFKEIQKAARKQNPQLSKKVGTILSNGISRNLTIKLKSSNFKIDSNAARIVSTRFAREFNRNLANRIRINPATGSGFAQRAQQAGRAYARSFNAGMNRSIGGIGRNMSSMSSRSVTQSINQTTRASQQLSASLRASMAVEGVTAAQRLASAVKLPMAALKGLGSVTGGLLSVFGKVASGVGSVGLNIGKSLANGINSGLKTTLKTAGIAAGVAAAAGGAVAVKTGASGLTRGLNIEDAQNKLKALRYTQEQITDIQNQSMNAVLGTRYSFDEAMSGAASALATGIKQADLGGFISLQTDLAAITGSDFKEISYIFNQVQSLGRVQAEEANMLVDRGIPIYKLMADVAGKSVSDISDSMRKGEVSSDLFFTALQKNFTGAAATASNTTRGYLRNLSASMARLGESFFNDKFRLLVKDLAGYTIPVFDALTKKYGPAFQKFWNDIYNKAIPAYKEFTKNLVGDINKGLDFTGFTDIINKFKELKPLVTSIFKMAENSPMSNIFKGVFNKDTFSSENIAKGVNFLKDNIIQPITELFKKIGPTIQNLVKGVMPIISKIIEVVTPIITMIGSTLLTLITPILNQLGPFLSQFAKYAGAFFGAIGEIFKGIDWNAIGEILAKIMEIVGGLISSLAPVLKPLGEAITVVINAAIGAIGNLMPVIKSIAEFLAKIFTSDQFLTYIKQISDFLGQLMNSVVDIAKAIWDALAPVLDALLPPLLNFVGQLGESLSNILKLFTPALTAVIQGIGVLLEFVAVGIGNLLQFFTDIIGFFTTGQMKWGNYNTGTSTFTNSTKNTGSGMKLSKMANGGLVLPSPGGSIVNIAEAGKPEKVIDAGKDNKRMDLTNKLLDRALNNKNNGNTYINNVSVSNANATAEDIVKAMYQQQWRDRRAI